MYTWTVGQNTRFNRGKKQKNREQLDKSDSFFPSFQDPRYTYIYIYMSSSLVRSKILADPDDEKRNHSPTFQPFQEPPKPSPSPSPSLSSPSLSFIGEISERSASKSRRGPISEDGDVGCRNDEGKVHRPIRCTSGREAWRIGIGGADGSMGSRSPNRVGGFQ